MHTDSSILKILLLLSFWSIAGSDRDPPWKYVKKNGSFCWKIVKPAPSDVRLEFNKLLVILSNKPVAAYKHRMDYNEENLNWCIHYVSEKDNGIYKLSVIRNETLKLESYHLVVEEAVPRPVIQILTSNHSDEACNITVKCSIWEDWVLAVCNGFACRRTGQSLGTVNITISAGNRSVTCRGSNHVSTSVISEKTCESDSSGMPPSNMLFIIVLTIGLLCVLLLALTLCLTLWLFCFSKKHQKDARPPQEIKSAEAARAPSVFSRVSNGSTQSDVSYENVSAVQSAQDSRVVSVHRGTEAGRDTREAPQPTSPTEVESVYTLLGKPSPQRKPQ